MKNHHLIEGRRSQAKRTKSRKKAPPQREAWPAKPTSIGLQKVQNTCYLKIIRNTNVSPKKVNGKNTIWANFYIIPRS